MISGFLKVILHLFGAIAAAAVLVFGFAFLILLGDAHARGRSLVSRGFDTVAMLVIYLSWFGLLWWFGFSTALLMTACAATIVLCSIYAASYHAALARQRSAPPP